MKQKHGLRTGYVLAEIKTNLDKTMFQEASATSHDVKTACTGAKYFLLCDYLDMTPINTATTDIEEILILRKAKRLASNIRSNFSDYNGRCQNRAMYVQYLNDHPYSHDVFKRFIDRIIIFMQETLDENKVLTDGFF